MLLVQPLGGRERAFGGEAEAVVRLALERREVVEHRRFLALLFLLELGDRPGLPSQAATIASASSSVPMRGPLVFPGLPRRRLEVADVGALAGRRLAVQRSRRANVASTSQ